MYYLQTTIAVYGDRERLVTSSMKRHIIKNQVFGVFSKPMGIVHCGVILVTLLGKASLWAGPEGSFQVLSARLELCHPSHCCQHGPSPSGCGAELNHRPLPLLATREGTLTSQLEHTHSRAHSH